VQKVDREKRDRGDQRVHAPLERARADLEHRFDDDRDHDRFTARQYGHDGRHVTVRGVDVGQSHEHEDRRNDEERTGDDPAPGAMQQPADVDRQLLGLRTGQQHAVVQSVEKALLADPAPPLDQLAVHDRNLSRRAAERDEAELDPEAQRVAERHRARHRRIGAATQRGTSSG
jgi:hypothetical protein